MNPEGTSPPEPPNSPRSGPRMAGGGFRGASRGRGRGSGRNPRRIRTIAIGLFAVVTFGLMFFRGLASFYTDYLWFDQLGHGEVFTSVFGAQIVLVLIFTFLFFALLFVNLRVANRLAPSIRPPGPEEDILGRFHELFGNKTLRIQLIVSIVLALIVGIGVSGRWQEWLLFTNGVDFSATDAQFGKDISFYVFQLPFLTFVVNWFFRSLLIVFFITVIAHYVNGGIRLQTSGDRVQPRVKAHLSVILAFLAIVKAVDYWFARFELTTSTRGHVDGASYTDVKAQLPATNLLILISLLAVVLLLVNIRRKGWVLPSLAVGLWAFVALVMGNIYPAVIQSLRVQPAESEKEALYIERNIDATRQAFGLDQVLEVQIDDFDTEITAVDLLSNASTVRNIRVLDPVVVQGTFDRLQGEREFYRFSDVLDSDRYQINGETTQVLLGARELDLNETRSWESQHVAFTHGYGLAMAPVSQVRGSGDPDFVIGDLPVSIDQSLEITLEKPQIYIGEGLGGYAVVGASRDEVDFTDENQETQDVRYDEIGGQGGVEINSFIRKTAFALRFGQIEPLISNFLTDDSRIIYVRDVRDRVEKLAPFLQFDSDPYPVILDGRMVYVVDGYTTTDRYPYSQRAPVSDLDRESGLRDRFNYVRNSVKAVVDAFDGDVKFYIVDPDDPIIQAYQSAFSGLFTPVSEMPEALVDHLRYPEDMFRVQSELWGAYHVDETENFYQRASEWAISQDPGRSGEGAANLALVDSQGVRIGTRDVRMSPYRTIVSLSDSTEAEYVILRAFVPLDEEDARKELAAYVVGRSDGENAGQLVVYRPPTSNFDGPALAEERIRNDEEVASLQTLLSQRGSDVLFGELLLVPIENSILYVRPLYVQADGDSTVPELERVIVVAGEKVVMENTLQEALEKLTGQSLSTLFPAQLSTSSPVSEPEEVTEEEPSEPSEPSEPIPEDLSGLVQEIEQLQIEAAQALAETPPDWITFGEIQSQIQDLLTVLASEVDN